MKAVLCVCVLALLAVSAVGVDVDHALRGQVEERDELTAQLLAGGKGFSQMKTPTNKNPKAPSDSGKPSKPKDEKAKVTPKLQTNTNAKATAALKGKLHLAPMSKEVTVVNKQQWAELKGIKPGQQLSGWINKVGGAIKTALSNILKGIVDFFRGNSRFAGSVTADKICKWVVAVDSSFTGSGWKYTEIGNSAKFGVYKPGTCMVGASVSRYGQYNCLDGATQKSNPQTASAFANANFVCLDKKGTMVSPPGNCKAKIQFYGAYKGSTYSYTDSYLVCPIGSRYIQASAAHEANLAVGSSVLASKGAVTSTGNSITETYSFTLTAGASAGTSKDGPASSANVGLSFGYTVQEVKDFGEKSNVVAFQNQGAYDVPFNAIITTVASAQINGAGRVWGSAQSSTDGWLMCVVATSTDCGMQNTGVSFGVGTPEQNALYAKACDGLKQNNQVRFSELGF